VIRLGSLAGYPFEGPRLLGAWTPPEVAAVYAVLYRPLPEEKPDRYAVIYADHADNLATARLPFRHPRAHCWVERAGSRWKVYIGTYVVPGGTRSHREAIVRELISVYRPRCNTERYDASWQNSWIGGES
jgi:hypothetical protein